MTDDDLPLDDDAAPAELGPYVQMLLADADLWEDPSEDLGDRVVAAVRSEATLEPPTRRTGGGRSWLKPAVLGAAAVVVFFVGGVAVFSALSEPSGTTELTAELVPTGLVDDVEGSIEVTSFSSGLQIDLDAPTLPRRDGGRFYEGWVRTADGELLSVGTFHEGGGVTLWAGIEANRIVAFSISLETAAAPDSPDQGPSGDVVLKVDLP